MNHTAAVLHEQADATDERERWKASSGHSPTKRKADMADKVLRWPSAAARPVDDGPLSDESDEEYDLLGINSNRTPRHDNFADM